jgi:D-alanyl-D-alanine carboxypeptidase/D-alanyl-D-alanine-endopeptidase (penicillin-binding protein 4)
MAELFFRTVALRQTGSGSADSAQAVGARALAAWGVTANDAAYRDGSGLSRHDYVTPRAIVKVLDAMRRSPHDMLFRDALPIAGVDGTIAGRMRETPAAGNVRAKTGTLDKARSLSGYVTTADGRLVMFSMLSNNFTLPTRDVERVQDLLLTTLASRPLGPLTPRVPR